MKILLTNDDGIQAQGLQELRRALRRLADIELAVIAPDSNRSATARSITTREPLWVEEVGFEDGTTGYATDGTPVDCIRFAELGLLEFKPELIVAGINHGANLGDDVTYSGTVAAALEGVVLGIPAIALSQVMERRGQTYRDLGSVDFGPAAAFGAALVEKAAQEGFPEGTLFNVNFPPPSRGEFQGVEVTTLGKRIYRDKLELETEEPGRRKYRIYGDDPSYHREEGTDFSAIAAGKISVTPVHFKLTAHRELDELRRWELERILA